MQAQRVVAPARRLRMRHHLYSGTSASVRIREHTHTYAVCMHLDVAGVERQRVASAVSAAYVSSVSSICQQCQQHMSAVCQHAEATRRFGGVSSICQQCQQHMSAAYVSSICQHAVCMYLEVVGVERQRVASAVWKQVHELCRLCKEALVRR